MESIYLSPAHARLSLANERDVDAAVVANVLEENHFLDLKREVKTGKAQNKETARDMAQFAVDGGTVLVGVTELDDGSLSQAPQPLDGLAERVEQIAATNVDPPLAVITHSIPTEANREVGYLVIHIPASPTAPHMVERRYVARGDKTKRYLTDPEVVRLHSLRSARELDGLELLHKEIALDVFADGPVGNAHGFFVAEPLTPRPNMLLAITDDPNYETFVNLPHTATQRSLALFGTSRRGGFIPDLDGFMGFVRRPASVARSSFGIEPGRKPREGDGYTNEESAGELELQDNGGVRIYTSRLSYGGSDGVRLLIESAVLGLTHHLLALTLQVAEQSGYFGNWTLGFGATGLLGTHSALLSEGWGNSHPYPDKTYERATTATYADLTQRPRELADEMVGGVLRGLGTRRAFLPALVTPQAEPS